MQTVQKEDGDVTFFLPGELEADPLDANCVSMTIDFQTAADLFALMPNEFTIDVGMLESPEDLLGDN